MTTRRVILLAGPSGSGKSTLARQSGLPILELDHFFHDRETAGLPWSPELGMIDWDDIRSWDHDGAMDAIRSLCRTGRALVPVYDIADSHRVGHTELTVPEGASFIAEGIFAPDLISDCVEEDLLADAIVLDRAPWHNFVRRLARDLWERRKPPPDLWRRGRGLWQNESDVIAHARACGCRALSATATRQALEHQARR